MAPDPTPQRVALITGGAKRVGRAIALELARCGCDIALHFHRSADAAGTTANDIRSLSRRCHLIQSDLAEPASWPELIEDAVSELGHINVLVNNASIFEPTPPHRFDVADWDRIMRINTAAPVGLSRAAQPHLRDAQDGNIVNLSDISADRPWADHLAYCASKAALANATRSMAKAFAPDIRVNAVAPGIAVFPDSYDQSTRQKLIDRVPLKRQGTPEAIAIAVRYLALEADFVTGQILNVDGGRSVV